MFGVVAVVPALATTLGASASIGIGRQCQHEHWAPVPALATTCLLYVALLDVRCIARCMIFVYM